MWLSQSVFCCPRCFLMHLKLGMALKARHLCGWRRAAGLKELYPEQEWTRRKSRGVFPESNTRSFPQQNQKPRRTGDTGLERCLSSANRVARSS